MSLGATSPFDTLTGSPLASQSFVNSVLGPPIVGWALQILGYGMLLSYFFSYVTSPAFADDKARLRWFLCVVFALCTFQSGLTFWLMFHYATCQERQIPSAEVLYGQTIADAMSVIPVGIEGALVQAFLAYRASGLFTSQRNKMMFLTFIGGGVLTGLFGAAAYTVLSVYYRAGRLNDVLPLTFQNVTGAWLWGCAVVDITISLGLGIQLYKRLGSINDNTNNVLVSLIRGAVKTASYTSVLALMGAILSFSFPPPSLAGQSAVSFYSPLAACYAFALIHTLASRSEIRNLSNGSAGATGTTKARGDIGMSVMHTIVTSGGRDEEDGGDFTTQSKFARVELTRDQPYGGEKENVRVMMPFGEAVKVNGRQ